MTYHISAACAPAAASLLSDSSVPPSPCQAYRCSPTLGRNVRAGAHIHVERSVPRSAARIFGFLEHALAPMPPRLHLLAGYNSFVNLHYRSHKPTSTDDATSLVAPAARQCRGYR
jgi:hypothetical protein